MNTLLLIDGNAIVHRAYYALPPMHTRDNLPTNAIYGFFTMLHKATIDFNPTHVVVCFDTPKPTFRKELFKEYQAQRPKVSDDFKAQTPYIRQLLDEGGIKRMEKPGFEADDVIGTLANRYKKEDLKIFILTGDRDIMQLVDKNVYVVTPKVGISTIVIYNDEEVVKKMGVKPTLIPDLKALTGDPSDNYSGVPGIGPKTAVKLLNHFGSVEKILTHIDEYPDERIKKLVSENKETLVLMHELATIKTDVDVPLELDECRFTGFNTEMISTLQNLELFGLMSRLFNKKKEEPKKVEKPKVEKKEDNSQLDLF